MNRQKFSSIAHRDHDYYNPISPAKIERMLDLLPLTGTSRVLDFDYVAGVRNANPTNADNGPGTQLQRGK